MTRTAILLAVVLWATSVPAMPVTFVLGDHPDAALYQSDPTSPYGLRFDAASPPGNGPTFSVATNLGGLGGPVTLTWDPANLAAGATITGTMERNDDGTLWTVNYALSGLVAAENGGFKATAGTGSADEIGGALRSIAMTGEADNTGYVFEFDDDGHRLGASAGWVGRGWLLPPDSTEDWLVTAEVIPVPAAAWLFGSALGLLGWLRRRSV